MGSMCSKISPMGRPYSEDSVSRTVWYGIGSASARSFASSSQNACGRISERIERICPTLTKVGPSASSMSRILTGVRPWMTSNWLAMRAICQSRLSLLRRVRWYRAANASLRREPNRPMSSATSASGVPGAYWRPCVYGNADVGAPDVEMSGAAVSDVGIFDVGVFDAEASGRFVAPDGCRPVLGDGDSLLIAASATVRCACATPDGYRWKSPTRPDRPWPRALP